MAAKRPKPSFLRRWTRRAIVALITIALGVGGAEIYLRYTTEDWLGPVVQQRGLVLQDGDGRLRPAPGFEGPIKWAGRETQVRLNRLGMRGPELEPRADNELRVLGVGDSIVFGFGAEVEEAFMTRLEPLLERATERPVTTGIAASPGLGTFDLEGVIAHVREPFAPDVVLVGVTLANDLTDNFEPTRVLVDGLVLTGPLGRAVDGSFRVRMSIRSRVCFVLENFLRQTQSSWAIQLPDGTPELEAFAHFPPNRHVSFMDREPSTPQIERILDRLEEGLKRVAAVTNGIDARVLIIPTPLHCRPKAYRAHLEAQQWNPDEFRRGALQERIAARAKRLGFGVIDLTEVLSAQPKPLGLFLPNDPHFTPEGHRVVAEYLAEVLGK